mmetsp:Transcript_43960/g.82144  ORF Transcript_43960/g.82144 Transcript_43960/m.82144 type:complete len:206 (-) Transcript_43960:790-1407(-)
MDSAAAHSSAVSSLPSPGFHLSSIMVFLSQRSASPSSKPCRESGSSKRPSCTGCSMMSHMATAPQTKQQAQETLLSVSRCLPGSALSVSLRTTKSGSSRSIRRSRQPSNQVAAKRAMRRAVMAHRCQLFRCGKQITSATEATKSSTRQEKNSPVCGGSAEFPTLGGERPHAAMAATNAMAAIKYTKFCHKYAWPGESAKARITLS